tara:strand:+ start:2083 stop:2406 length:324 start_codon:yes stop_codon:yes gene_type:complete
VVKALNCALKTFLFCANQCKTTKENNMCGGGSKRSQADIDAEAKRAADDRIAAEDAKREEIEEKAEQKREDIGEAVESRTESKGMRGGKGRRSLFKAGGGGFLDRFS